MRGLQTLLGSNSRSRVHRGRDSLVGFPPRPTFHVRYSHFSCFRRDVLFHRHRSREFISGCEYVADPIVAESVIRDELPSANMKTFRVRAYAGPAWGTGATHDSLYSLILFLFFSLELRNYADLRGHTVVSASTSPPQIVERLESSPKLDGIALARLTGPESKSRVVPEYVPRDLRCLCVVALYKTISWSFHVAVVPSRAGYGPMVLPCCPYP